jgi:hypothetical protein
MKALLSKLAEKRRPKLQIVGELAACFEFSK